MAEYVVVNKAQLNDILAELRSFQGPEMEKRLKSATLAGANALKGPTRAEAPVRTGTLAASTKVQQVRTGGSRGVRGQWVGYRVVVGGKGARYANVVIGGSKAHRIRGKVGEALGLPFGPRAVVHHPGSKANPYVGRVGERDGDLVLTAMAKRIARDRTHL